MNQIKQLLGSLTIRQRIWIVVVALAAGAGLYGLSRWQHERDYRPLYKALAAEDAGAVVQRLKENGVDYRLAENGATVLVPSARVAELRINMAAAGVPSRSACALPTTPPPARATARGRRPPVTPGPRATER